MARWVGERLRDPRPYDGSEDVPVAKHVAWPRAAWGVPGAAAHRAELSAWPARLEYQHLEDFLAEDAAPLSERATRGFLDRARRSSLRFPEGFLDEVAAHLERACDRSLAA
jgi:DNA (cytosine-5)-methyltransferase 1